MKKIIFLAILLGFASAAFAQTLNMVRIEKSDGSTLDYVASDIANISFLQMSTAEIWKKMPELLGSTIESSRKAMAKENYHFAYSSTSYSLDGADYYIVSNNLYISSIAFAFNANQIATEIWVYVNPKMEDDVYKSIEEEYISSDESHEVGEIPFYNESGTLKVIYNVKYSCIIYKDLTIKPAVRENPWGDYYQTLLMTKEQVRDLMGNPYDEDDTSFTYLINSPFAYATVMIFDKNSGVCAQVQMYVRSSITKEEVIASMNDEYTIYAPYTKDDGSQYAWLNAEASNEATMLIGYWPDDGLVAYFPFSSSNAKQRFTLDNIDLNIKIPH